MFSSFWVSQLFPDFVSAKAQNSRDFTSFKGTNSRSKSFNFFNHVTLIIPPITVSYWRDQLFHLLNVTVQSANSIPDLPQIISKLSQAEYTRLLSHSFVLIPRNEDKLFQQQRQVLLFSHWIENRGNLFIIMTRKGKEFSNSYGKSAAKLHEDPAVLVFCPR